MDINAVLVSLIAELQFDRSNLQEALARTQEHADHVETARQALAEENRRLRQSVDDLTAAQEKFGPSGS